MASLARLKRTFRQEMREILPGSVLVACLGVVFSWLWIRDGWLHVARPRLVWEEATFRITSKRVDPLPPGTETPRTFLPVLTFEVHARGAKYLGSTYEPWNESMGHAAAGKVVGAFEVGSFYPCWHDPDNPSNAVLYRRVNGWWVSVGLGIIPMTLLSVAAIVFPFLSARPPSGRRR